MKWRRYRDAHGATHETYEVPAAVIRRLGASWLKDALDRAERRQAARARQARVLQLLADGWKPLAIANEVGLSEQHIYRIKYAGKAGAKTYGAKSPRSR